MIVMDTDNLSCLEWSSEERSGSRMSAGGSSAIADPEDVLPSQPISGGLGSVEVGSFSVCQWFIAKVCSNSSAKFRRNINTHSLAASACCRSV